MSDENSSFTAGDKGAHLGMIQGVISRMGSNSFAVKAWAVGLVAAVFALAVSEGASPGLFRIALLPAVMFWGLDAYYLRQEKLFRRLYDAVRWDRVDEKSTGPFSMDTEPYKKEETQVSAFMSWTVAGLYIPLIALVLIVAAFARR